MADPGPNLPGEAQFDVHSALTVAQMLCRLQVYVRAGGAWCTAAAGDRSRASGLPVRLHLCDRGWRLAERRPGLGQVAGAKKRPKNPGRGVSMYVARCVCHVSVARASLRAPSHVGSRFAAHGKGIPYDALVGGARPSRSVGGAGAVYLTYLLT